MTCTSRTRVEQLRGLDTPDLFGIAIPMVGHRIPVPALVSGESALLRLQIDSLK
jgi:hypothetical protein